MRLAVAIESWPLAEPFETARERQTTVDMVHVRLTAPDGATGQAEAVGVSEHGETPELLRAQIEAIAGSLDDGHSRDRLQHLLPAGGARNALDCALWDLDAKRSGIRPWEQAGLTAATPLATAYTIGLGSPEETAARAARAAGMPLIKIKLNARRNIDVVRLVRDHAPDARLIVDANQAFTRAMLEPMLPALVDAGVELIEQPVPQGEDEQLRGLGSPIPLGADESCTDRGSLAGLAGLYDAVNIKLDKTGGLTEALALAAEARALGLDIMVGCMCGTSLGMAAAWPIALQSRWIDLDGPLLLTRDREPGLTIVNGLIEPPIRELWG